MPSCRHWLAVAVVIAGPTLASAELRFAQPTVDLGPLRGGPVQSQRFDFVNKSDHAIEITDIRLGCGCLQPILEKRTYQPAEKGSLVMQIRTLGQPDGERTWQAHVQYREGEKLQETRLIMAATIRNEVTIEPSIVGMNVATILRQQVTITDHRASPMKISAVQPSSPAIQVHVEAQGKGVTKVTLEVRGAALTAPRQEEMLNIYTDDPNYRHLQVPITLMKASSSAVSATPDHVALHVGTIASKLIRLRAAGDQKMVVQKVEADHPAVKCTWASGPGNEVTLKIVADARSLTSASTSALVRVLLLEPSVKTLTIPVALVKD